jgi:hypothetical protein
MSSAWVTHWNGSSWRDESLPFRWKDASALTGIGEAADGTLVTIGEDITRQRPLIMTRDAAGWHHLPIPQPVNPACATAQISLSQVSIQSRHEIWLAANGNHFSGQCPLVFEWTGFRWVDRSAGVLYRGFLGTTVNSILSTSANNVLLGGSFATDWTDDAFVDQWNGHRWVMQSFDPNVPINEGESEIDSFSTDGQSIWAAGWLDNPTLFTYSGGLWHQEPMQNVPTDASYSDIAVTQGHVFAVGGRTSGHNLVDQR